MALIKWGDNTEENKYDPFNVLNKPVASVQESAWGSPSVDSNVLKEQSVPQQAAIFGQSQHQVTPVVDNYLLSEEKAQVDQKKQRRDAEIQAAREQAAIIQNTQKAANVSKQFSQGQAVSQDGEKLNVEVIKKDVGWKKYYDEEFNKKKDSLDFWGRLMDGGQSSRFAENAARNRYNSELIRQAYDENGNTLDEGAAIQARKLTAYNSSLAEDNSNRSLVNARAIGATKDNQGEGFWNRVKNGINAEKQMSIYDGIVGADDSQTTSFNDVGRFVSNFGQGIFTLPVIGAKDVVESVAGGGTDTQTGFQKDLGVGERIGRGISGALNVVTPFVGGSGKLLDSLTTKVLKDTATVAEETILKRLTAKLLFPAIEQGGIGVAQSGAEYFGNGNTLLDENGDFDKQKLLEFAKQTGEAGATAFAGGLVLGGAGMGLNKLRRRNLTPVKDIPAADGGLKLPEDIPTQTLIDRVPESLVPVKDIPEVAAVNDPNSQVVGTDEPTISQKPKEVEAQKPLKHFTSKESAKALAAGAPFDYTKNPIHGTGGKDFAVKTSRIVDDGQPAMYLSMDDKKWNKELSPNLDAKIIDTNKMTLPEYEQFIKDGGTSFFNYKTQEYEGRMNAFIKTPLESVDYYVKSDARKLTIDSPEKLMEVGKSVGKHPDDPKFWTELRKDYDVVEIKNVDESSQISEMDNKTAKRFFSAAKGDQAIVLNPDVVSIKPFGVSPPKVDAPKAVLSDAVPVIAKTAPTKQVDPISLTPIRNMPEVAAVNDPNSQVVGTDEVTALQDARAGKSQADEAVINQKLQELEAQQLPRDSVPAQTTPLQSENITPIKENSVPDGMGVEPKAIAPDLRKEMVKRIISTIDEPKEYINQVAQAISVDGASPIKADDMRETLSMYGDRGDATLKNRIIDKYERLKKMIVEYNVTQSTNRKNLTEGTIDSVDTVITKDRSTLQKEMASLQKDLVGDIKKLTAQTSGKARAKMVYDNLNNYRKSNILLSAPSIERNVAQDILGLINDVVKNPVLMGKALLKYPEEYIRSIHNAAREWRALPKTASEIPKYIIGNAYNSIMSLTGVEGAVRARNVGYRGVEARNMLIKLGETVNSENISKMSKIMGNEAELMSQTAAGVANFMTSNTQFKKVSDAYNNYIDNGNPLERQKFFDNVSHQSTVTEQIKQQLVKGDSPLGKVAAMALDFISPFVRTATNAVDTTITGTLNPFSKSAADYILSSNRSKLRNGVAIVQNKAIDGAVIAGTVGLISSGAIVYNDGSDVNKPQGLSIKSPFGENTYIPIRATHVELTVALIYTAMQIKKDIEDGSITPGSTTKYLKIIDGSLPYVDSILQTNKAVGSATSDQENGGDNGYRAKAYGINAIKSYVPVSNNNLQPYIAGKQGESLNAKSSYNEDPKTWLINSLKSSYSPAFRATLPDSRDAAGQVRTVDNQGALINKTINDPNTAEFNDRITSLVDYGRKSGFGKDTQEMFNTYDTGKNNNFKSIQDSINYTDAPTVNGKNKPDNTKKLEKNEKLANLSTQMRDGFYGDTGMNLLKLDGKELQSDVSLPNKSGTKNTRLPMNMQSIKNAIAATDLSEEERSIMYEIKQKNDELFAQRKAKTITYKQEQAMKAENEKTYTDILSHSKNYAKMTDLMDNLDQSGFFKADGLGATRSGQTYLWNSLNTLLGSKGTTPAANYPKDDRGFTPYGRGGGGGSGFNATNKPGLGDRGNTGIQWSPVGKRQMASVTSSKYTPVNIRVKLGNEVRKDKTQNYSDKSF